jgi:hypothetical protein
MLCIFTRPSKRNSSRRPRQFPRSFRFESLETRTLMAASLFNPTAAAAFEAASRVNSDPIVVSTLNDERDGDLSAGHLSLREALETARKRLGRDTILFQQDLAGGTLQIDPRLGVLQADNVDLVIAEGVSVHASADSKVTISGGSRLKIEGAWTADNSATLDSGTYSSGRVEVADGGQMVANPGARIFGKLELIANPGGEMQLTGVNFQARYPADPNIHFCPGSHGALANSSVPGRLLLQSDDVQIQGNTFLYSSPDLSRGRIDYFSGLATVYTDADLVPQLKNNVFAGPRVQIIGIAPGTLNQETQWTPMGMAGIYRLEGDLLVGPEGKLTINPGTKSSGPHVVLCGVDIQVQGRLEMQGVDLEGKGKRVGSPMPSYPSVVVQDGGVAQFAAADLQHEIQFLAKAGGELDLQGTTIDRVTSEGAAPRVIYQPGCRGSVADSTFKTAFLGLDSLDVSIQRTHFKDAEPVGVSARCVPQLEGNYFDRGSPQTIHVSLTPLATAVTWNVMGNANRYQISRPFNIDGFPDGLLIEPTGSLTITSGVQVGLRMSDAPDDPKYPTVLKVQGRLTAEGATFLGNASSWKNDLGETHIDWSTLDVQPGATVSLTDSQVTGRWQIAVGGQLNTSNTRINTSVYRTTEIVLLPKPLLGHELAPRDWTPDLQIAAGGLWEAGAGTRLEGQWQMHVLGALTADGTTFVKTREHLFPDLAVDSGGVINVSNSTFTYTDKSWLRVHLNEGSTGRLANNYLKCVFEMYTDGVELDNNEVPDGAAVQTYPLLVPRLEKTNFTGTSPQAICIGRPSTREIPAGATDWSTVVVEGEVTWKKIGCRSRPCPTKAALRCLER